MAGLKAPETREEQDLAHSPQEDYDKRFNDITDGFKTNAQDLQEIEDYAGSNKNATSDQSDNPSNPSANITDTQKREGGLIDGRWATNITAGGPKKTKFSLKGLRTKGPVFAIISSLLGGATFFSIMLAPGIGIVQFKEALVDDLNDQLAASDIRTDHVFRAKLKSMQTGASICSDAVKIRCKFRTMPERQLKKFRNAGWKIETEKTAPFGRQRITSMSFTDSNGKVTNITDPGALQQAARENPQVHNALRQAFNPKFATVKDLVARKVFKRFKTSPVRQVSGDTDEERDKNFDQKTSGETAEMSAKGTITDTDGREYVLDDDGKKVYQSGEGANADKFNEIAERNRVALENGITNRPSTRASPARKALMSSGLKGLSAVGATDSACTIYNLSRAVSAALKMSAMMQYVQFFMQSANTADESKAGVAEPDQVTYIGNMLTATDNQKTIVDADSKLGENGEATPRENPHYGENAFDSEGYATAAYNDAPSLDSSALQYAAGGAMSGALASTLDQVTKMLGGRENARKTCKVVQSGWVRAAGLIAGVVMAAGSFGLSTVLQIGASVAIAFATPYLMSMIKDIMSGNMVSSKTKGRDAGNVSFVGAAGLLGGFAKGRGMKPANRGEMKDYALVAKRVKSEYVALETYNAKKTPFDVNNQYSFLGSAVRKVNPAILKSSASISGALTAIPSILGTAASSVLPHASAANTFNEERFKKCNDEGYRELNIDADIFCNVRYILTSEELDMDPDVALNYMLSNGHIDNDGNPVSEDYKNWIKHCAEREAGWGETENDDNVSDWDVGKECVAPSKEPRNKHFRVFTIDKSLNDSMEDEPQSNNSANEDNPSDDNAAGQRPANTVTKGKGWSLKPGQDYSNIKCDPAHRDLGKYHHPIQKVTIRICKTGERTSVSSLVSSTVKKMMSDAVTAGVSLKIESGFRTYERQKELYDKNCRGGSCNPPTAKPGNSQHEIGLAIDWSGMTSSSAGFNWLKKNAQKYGYYNLPSEAWHWSTSGT